MRLFKTGSNKILCTVLLLWVPVLIAKPIVIAHRGASGYLPEHTLAAYEKAIDMGADYIEPDLVITKDGHLIARHEHYLGKTTDVSEHEAFADRLKSVDGREDWYTEDFTLEEVKTLRARQAFTGRSDAHDDKYPIPTLQEIVELVKRKSEEMGRTVGIYPETKVPGHFASLGYDFAALLMKTLEKNNLAEAGIDVFIQSFERPILERLDRITDLPLVQLVTPVSDEERNIPDTPLKEVATYADGIGAYKVLLTNDEGDSSGVIEAAHQLGLFVHAWTFRDDAWPEEYFASGRAEIAYYLRLGVDGFFTDFPDTGVSVRDRFWANQPSNSEWPHYGGYEYEGQ